MAAPLKSQVIRLRCLVGLLLMLMAALASGASQARQYTSGSHQFLAPILSTSGVTHKAPGSPIQTPQRKQGSSTLVTCDDAGMPPRSFVAQPALLPIAPHSPAPVANLPFGPSDYGCCLRAPPAF